MISSRPDGTVPDVSFILPVYNKATALPYFFASLLAQQGKFSREVIFIDDASTDASRSVLDSLAAKHDFVRVIANDANAGPAIRLNQGAVQAQGKYLALFDCDELLAPDAIAVMLDLAHDHDADMVHGRGRKTDTPIEQAKAGMIGNDIDVKTFDDALGRILGRGMVRMTWLVERVLFERAGGCDPDVFIQDESLPLRLSLHARRMIDAKMIVTAIPDAGSHLSANKMQQHHDRFLTYANFLRAHPEIAADKRRKIFGKCISAARKAKRDGAPFNKSDLELRYLAHKIGLGRNDSADLSRFASVFQNLSGIRRPAKP